MVKRSPSLSTTVLGFRVTVGGTFKIVTVCVAVPVLPAASVALHTTTWLPVVYGPKGLAVGINTPLTVSTAVAVPSDTGVRTAVARIEISAGGVTIGGVVSCTVTANIALVLLPEASVAVTVTVVIPSGKVEPEAEL